MNTGDRPGVGHAFGCEDKWPRQATRHTPLVGDLLDAWCSRPGGLRQAVRMAPACQRLGLGRGQKTPGVKGRCGFGGYWEYSQAWEDGGV